MRPVTVALLVAALLPLALVAARPTGLLPGAVLSADSDASTSTTLPLVPAVKADPQPEFDYFMLVRQWPGGYCSQHSCPRLHTHGFQFTIHGLWPNYNNGRWPQFCNPGLPFKENDIDDLEDVMDSDWPSFMGANTDFWAHEWNKHGTCAMHVMASEHTYFNSVLNLNYKLDLSAAFRAGGIMPSNTRTYRKQTVLDAIDLLYNTDAQLHCGPDGTLMEVWMCVDKDLKPFTCKAAAPAPNAVDNCANIRLPPPPVMMGSVAEWVSPRHTGDKAQQQAAGAAAGAAEAGEEPRAQRLDPAEEQEVKEEGHHAHSGPEHEHEEKHKGEHHDGDSHDDHHSHKHDDDDDDDEEEEEAGEQHGDHEGQHGDGDHHHDDHPAHGGDEDEEEDGDHKVGKMDPGEKEEEREKREQEKEDERREREEEKEEREKEKEDDKKHGDHDHDHDHDHDGDDDGPEVRPDSDDDTPSSGGHHHHHHDDDDDDDDDGKKGKKDDGKAAVSGAAAFIHLTESSGKRHGAGGGGGVPAVVWSALPGVAVVLVGAALVAVVRGGLRAAAKVQATSARAGHEAQLLAAASDPEAGVYEVLLGGEPPVGEEEAHVADSRN